MSKAHFGLSEITRTALTTAQTERVEQLLTIAKNGGFSRIVMTHLLDVMIARGGDPALLRGARRSALERADQMGAFVDRECEAHEELHALIQNRPVHCHPGKRTACKSQLPILRQHFEICRSLDGYATGAMGLAIIARLKVRHFDGLPAGTETLGGCVRFMVETLAFRQKDVALLRGWREGRLPMDGDQMAAAYDAVRTAYSTYKRSRVPGKQLVSEPKRAAKRSV